ncbi:MAG TPA: hypothetical protein VL693_16205 [Vicinamibacterales bacterium]|jgi:uncharacterized protein (DUF1501 family)|nr:hypothetical protein [Vicinamibacterales bacterium]
MSDLPALLTEFAAGRVALLERHEASARAVSHYDFNNTYQYVINREETHLSWLQNALAEYKAVVPPAGVSALAVPAAPKTGKKVEASAFRSILDEDAGSLGAFVEKWRPRVDDVMHARHRNMLNVILGESLEHKRLFEQAAAGMEDLLGRRTGGVERVGGVLPTRWLE